MAKRLFVGIPVPHSIQKSLRIYTEALPRDIIRLVKPENYHITISFFGEQDGSNVGNISAVISEVTSSVSPFVLSFDRITLAPPKRPPSMIWASYKSNKEFSRLVSAIEEQLKPLIEFGDKRNGHAPIPHITLARFKNAVIDPLPPVELDSITVNSISLFESKLTENGLIYTELEKFPLLSV